MVLFDVFIMILGCYILSNIIIPNLLHIICILYISSYFNISLYYLLYYLYSKLNVKPIRTIFDFIENIIRYPSYINNLFIYMENRIEKIYQIVQIFNMLYKSTILISNKENGKSGDGKESKEGKEEGKEGKESKQGKQDIQDIDSSDIDDIFYKD
jgi:hypothetical protein